MAAFVFKSEPSEYSFADLVRDGSCVWTGITSNAALAHLRTARPGDAVFLYHTADEKAIVAEARVTSMPRPDPASPALTPRGEPKFAIVDLVPVRPAPRPLPLADMRPDERFAGFALLTQSRLSVIPVPAPIETLIRALTGLTAGPGGASVGTPAKRLPKPAARRSTSPKKGKPA